MNFLDLATKRYSVRRYADKKVEQEKLQKILEAAKIAPTARNNQPFKLIIVESDEGLSKLARSANVYGAPLAIIVCCNLDECWERASDCRKTNDIDVSIVTDHMMLEATELNLGTVWVCNFNCKTIVEDFNIPNQYEPVNILVIGHSAGDEPNPRHFVRKDLSDFVIKEHF